LKRILIYSGTTEGRELSEILSSSGIECDVCVATQYGQQVMGQLPGINILCNRLDVDGMRKLYAENDYFAVVDATHPYATVVTKTIRESLENVEIPYMRLLRESEALNTDICEYENAAQCAEALLNTKGNILLTTGSKELSEVAKYEELRERIIARVIPSMESLQICNDSGLKGSQIIAIQGPFSKEMNIAQIRQFNITQLVTKLSGSTGGEDDKIAAAIECKVTVHGIKRPSEESDHAGLTLGEVLKEIGKITGMPVAKKKAEIFLIGIGCGDSEMMTGEASKAISKADVIFGAGRMLESVKRSVKKYPYYLAEDIIPVLRNMYENAGCLKAAVLLSGDTGFYSGCEKLKSELDGCDFAEVKIIPGISSIQALAARCGISWSDAVIISGHGAENSDWIRELAMSVRYNKKVFFITSGAGDINKAGEILKGSDIRKELDIYVGYNLSYPDEKVSKMTPEEMTGVNEKGLYAGVIVNKKAAGKVLTPHLKDSDFERDKVPMTKENIRKLSICQMELTKDSVVYDIGSGTGSIAVETALLSPGIRVYAIECKEEAVKLIGCNLKKHGLKNVEVIKAMAPEGLDELPKATHAFIGGSRGNLNAIIDKLRSINKDMRVVMNGVSLESIAAMNELVKNQDICNLSISQVSSSSIKMLGEYSMPDAGNPVYIFAFNLK